MNLSENATRRSSFVLDVEGEKEFVGTVDDEVVLGDELLLFK